MLNAFKDWIYGEYIDLDINCQENLQLDLLESDFNGRLVIAKNYNSKTMKRFDLGQFEILEEINTGKGNVYCSKSGDFLCTIESNCLEIRRFENSSIIHGKVDFSKSTIGHVYMSNNFASILFRNEKSPLIIDLKTSAVNSLPYYSSFSCISPDERVILVHNGTSIFYHELNSLKLLMSIDNVTEIPKQVLFFNKNSNFLILSKDTNQITHFKLTLKKKHHIREYIIQDADITEMKMSNDESVLLICSSNSIYIFDSANMSMRFKIVSSSIDNFLNGNEIRVKDSVFTGFGITRNNRIIYATIFTYLVCFDSRDGKIIRLFQSSLSANQIIKSIGSLSSNTFVSLLDDNKLLVWDLNCFEHGNSYKMFKFENKNVYNGPIKGLVLPQIAHNSELNSNLVLSYSNSYPNVKVHSLKRNLSVNEIISTQNDNSEIRQLDLDENGRYCYLEYDVENFEGKKVPVENDFIKKQCLIIDLKRDNRQIESFVYVIRKNSSFRIKTAFINHDKNTYLVLKTTSCLNDFDPFSSNDLDWIEFENLIRVYGPLETSPLKLLNEFRLSGESLESGFCLTKSQIFASLMHECNKLMDNEQLNVVKAKRYDIRLYICKLFNKPGIKSSNVQNYGLNEFLNDNEYSNSNMFLDLRVVFNDKLLLIYSKERTSKYQYGYNEYKFQRDFRTSKAAVIYDPGTYTVIKRFSNFLRDESNVEKVILSGLFLLDSDWNLFNLKSGLFERSVKKNVEIFNFDFDHCLFLLEGKYLVTCTIRKDKILIVRTSDSLIVASYRINDKIALIRVGETDRTILVGTQNGCLLGFKFIIDLEVKLAVESYVTFYRDNKTEECVKKSSDNKQMDFTGDIKRITHSAFEYRRQKMRDRDRNLFSSMSSEKSSQNWSENIGDHVGVSKMNLANISSGIKRVHSNETRACLIQ